MNNLKLIFWNSRPGPQFILALFLLISGQLLLPAQATGAEKHATKPIKRIIIGGGKNFRPMMFTDQTGQPAGMHIDLWKLWAKKAGVKISFRLTDWHQVIPALQEGKVDAVIGATFTQERDRFLDFSDPYDVTTTLIFCHTSIKDVKTLKDLKDYPVGILMGSNTVQQVLRDCPGIKLVPYKNPLEMVRATIDRKISIVISQGPILAHYYALEGKKLDFSPTSAPLYTNDIRAAVLSGRSDLLKLFKKGMAEITPADREAILQHWVGAALTTKIPWGTIAWFLGAILVASLLLLAWIFQLRRHVNHATLALRRNEIEIRRLQNYLSNIIESMPSMLVSVDKLGNITQLNQRARLVASSSGKDQLGRPLAEVFPMLKEHAQIIQSVISENCSRKDVKTSRMVDGKLVFEEVTFYPLVANGVEGAVIRVDDVTEKIRLERMMVQSEKMLSVGALAAGMAHEINNPLAGMMQTAEVLSYRLTSELPANNRTAKESGTSMPAIREFMNKREVPRMLTAIRESGLRTARIVKSMLNFARKSDSASSSCNMAELLDQTIELAGTDYNLKKKYDFKQIKITRNYQENLPCLPCQSQEIQQVLLNILKNGAEAMQESHSDRQSQFAIKICSEEEMLRIEITDNGPGMDEETRNRIFEPFFTTKPQGKGTGLGLSVSYFIITENHSGEMHVESEPDHGTTFIIRLPLTPNVPSSDNTKMTSTRDQ
jgi:PAS domain S-box-containing protein